jgi:hypothetical protein
MLDPAVPLSSIDARAAQFQKRQPLPPLAAEVAVAARLLMLELVLPSPTLFCLPQKQLSSAAFPADVEVVLNKTLLAI